MNLHAAYFNGKVSGTNIYRIYYIKINYMFRPLTMAIFRLRLKNSVSSYTRLMWALYSGEVRGDVGTRSPMCYTEWAVWVHIITEPHVPTPPILRNTCEISCPPHLLPPSV